MSLRSSTPERSSRVLVREFFLHHRCCPMDRTSDGRILIAVAPDVVEEALDEIAIAYQKPIATREVTAEELVRLIERLAMTSDHALAPGHNPSTGAGEVDDLTMDTRDLASHPPVVRYVNMLLRDATTSAPRTSI